MGQPVVHFEIGCRDSQKTQTFYASLFDWKVEQQGPAAMIATGASTGIHGHITALGQTMEEALATAQEAASRIEFEVKQ